ncbi:MAG: hypothetical protein K2P76_08530 [Lachnospiraceae bacterium]|nr:hypothetical protein [Lachnospiraceae bacterium]
MPETDTKVSLYFPDEDERNAITVNCIRQNGASCSGMSDPSKRALTTAEGKRLYLEPGMMGGDVKSAGHAMSLEDGKSIFFRSGTTVNICAVENVGLFAKKIIVNSPQALNILRPRRIKGVDKARKGESMASIVKGKYGLVGSGYGITGISMEGGEINLFGNNYTMIKTSAIDSFPQVKDINLESKEPVEEKEENFTKDEVLTGYVVTGLLAGQAIGGVLLAPVTGGASLGLIVILELQPLEQV